MYVFIGKVNMLLINYVNYLFKFCLFFLPAKANQNKSPFQATWQSFYWFSLHSDLIIHKHISAPIIKQILKSEYCMK